MKIISRLAFLCLPVLTFAEDLETEAPTELDPLPVYALPTEADVGVSATSTHFFQDLDLSSDSIGNAVAAFPGVYFAQPGGPGGRATLYLRGAEENFTLVYLDGVPLNDPTNSRGGAVDLSTLELASLEAISVVRGAASVRHGPEALAGVVHLTTSRPTGVPEARIRGDLGEDEFRRGFIDLATPLTKRITGRLFASATENGQDERGSDERQSLHAAVEMTGEWNLSLTAWSGSLRARSFPDDSGGEKFAVIRDLETRENDHSGVRLALDTIRNDTRWTFETTFSRFETQIESPGVAPGVRDPMGLPTTTEDRTFERTQGQVCWKSADLANLEWMIGADALREWGKSEGSLDYGFYQAPVSFSLDRTRGGVFGEIRASLLESLSGTLGIRGDAYEDTASRITFRGGLRGEIDPQTEWSLAAGNAFKQPSFYALAHPLVGNPELAPERGYNLNLGLSRTFLEDRLRFETNLFHSRFEDGIDFDAGPPPQLVNRSKIETSGVELQAMWRPIPALRLESALTWLKARAAGEKLRGRPDWTFASRLFWEVNPQWEVQLSSHYVGEIPDTSIPTGEVTVGDFHRLDLAVTWRPSECLRFFWFDPEPARCIT